MTVWLSWSRRRSSLSRRSEADKGKRASAMRNPGFVFEEWKLLLEVALVSCATKAQNVGEEKNSNLRYGCLPYYARSDCCLEPLSHLSSKSPCRQTHLAEAVEFISRCRIVASPVAGCRAATLSEASPFLPPWAWELRLTSCKASREYLRAD